MLLTVWRMAHSGFAMASINDFIREWESDSDFILAHTSGSTGTPKDICLLKSDMRASARATNRRFGINSASVLGLPLSVEYIAGKMMCVRAIEAGATIVEMPVSNTVTVESPIDLLAVVPSQVPSLLSQQNAPALIKNLIIGGAPLDAKKAKELNNKGFNAFSTYGMTETCSHVALSNIADVSHAYHAMPGISFRTDERSCLVIDAPAFSFGTLITNDIVTLIDRETFIWNGRYDNVINSGGIKIPAEQLEREIAQIISRPFYIVACPDECWGEVPALVFEGEQTEASMMLENLRARIDHRICPRKLIAVKELPRTQNGKIRRKPIDSL